MDPRLLRLIGIGLFLTALGVLFVAWPQIGGQEHLDPIDWHWKLTLGVVFSLSVARAAQAAAREEKAWNARLVPWFLMVILTVLAMGYLTYQAHLEEPADDSVELSEEDPGIPRSL